MGHGELVLGFTAGDWLKIRYTTSSVTRKVAIQVLYPSFIRLAGSMGDKPTANTVNDRWAAHVRPLIRGFVMAALAIKKAHLSIQSAPCEIIWGSDFKHRMNCQDGLGYQSLIWCSKHCSSEYRWSANQLVSVCFWILYAPRIKMG